MNRSDFQKLAAVRLREAEALLAAALWDGAYYLSGYAIECGLKACILARIEREGVIFDADNKKFVEKCWTHDIEVLLTQAGLTPDRDALAAATPAFQQNWLIAKDWDEASRYSVGRLEADARRLVQAISDPTYGVLPWISTRW